MAAVRHPNRETASSRATKAGVVLLLLVSAALIALVTAGGWSALQGAQPVAFGYVVAYLVMAVYVARWKRGLLAVAVAFAVLIAVIATIAGPAWFARDNPGFHDPALDPALLGLLTLSLVPIQLMLILLAIRGFRQRWNVEVEADRGDAPRRGPASRRREELAGARGRL